jgi:Family of unknown function (DUF6311)
MTRIVAALLGAAFFVWLAGWRLVSPLEYQWAMKFDWRIHFLGWHIFRGEPWGWPPGMLSGYYHAPDGTSIGYTDSLPIVAFLLKPFSSILPMPMQYLGVWIAGCFAAQGWWGVRLAALFTRSALAQLLAAMLLVLTPTLLNRAAHPALCAQWLLLWAIWLYLKWRPGDPVPLGSMAALGIVSGLVHPYLAVMVVSLLVALALRMTIEERGGQRMVAWLGVVASSVLMLLGWWASGMFVVPGTAMARPGLGRFSMNVLAVVTPSGWSAFLPAIPTAADGQGFEGFQYLGLGLLLTVTTAVVSAGFRANRRMLASLGPLVAVCAVQALYSLSPRVTFADHVIVDYSSSSLDRLAVFGVTGRFFWPAGYTLVVLAIGGILRGLPSRAAVGLLAAAVATQLADLHPAFQERLALTRSQDFHAWPSDPKSPVWAVALPHYDHIVLVNPLQCGPAPVTFELPAFLAGLYGLSVNVGEVARSSEPARAEYCADLDRAVTAGEVDDRSLYLVHPDHEARLRAKAPALRCGTVEGIRVCVTARSYQAWRDAAPFE